MRMYPEIQSLKYGNALTADLFRYSLSGVNFKFQRNNQLDTMSAQIAMYVYYNLARASANTLLHSVILSFPELALCKSAYKHTKRIRDEPILF